MIQRFYCVFAIFFTLYNLSFAQRDLNSYKFEQIDSLQLKQKRNLVIFIHTQWCKYCKAMQNTTLSDEKIKDLLNDQFYYINLDAEQEDDIFFGDKIFKFRPTGMSIGVHELAEQLATINNSINFPTVCILNPENEIIFQHDQYINARKLEPILQRLSK